MAMPLGPIDPKSPQSVAGWVISPEGRKYGLLGADPGMGHLQRLNQYYEDTLRAIRSMPTTEYPPEIIELIMDARNHALPSHPGNPPCACIRCRAARLPLPGDKFKTKVGE